MNILERTNVLREKKVARANADYLRAVLESDKDREINAARMLMELGAVTMEDDIFIRTIKKYPGKFGRDIRKGKFTVRWIYGNMDKVFGIQVRVPTRNVDVIEYGMEGTSIYEGMNLDFVCREVDTTNGVDKAIEYMRDLKKKDSRISVFRSTRELMTGGGLLVYKIETPENYIYIGKPLGYITVGLSLKSAGNYACTTYIDKGDCAKLHIKYTDVLDRIEKEIKRSIGQRNNKKIEFKHLG